MKAILEFNFESDNFDKESFDLMMKSQQMASFIDEFQEFMTYQTKHCYDNLSSDTLDVMEKWKDRFFELKHENELYL